MAARSFLGAGDALIEIIENGVGQGLEGPFKLNKLSLQPNVDTKTSTSKGRYDYGQTLESVNLAQPSDLSMEFKEVVGSVLAMAFMGTRAALSATAGTLTDFVGAAKRGFWTETGKLNLAADVTVKTQVARTGVYALQGGSTGNPTSGAVVITNNTLTGAYVATFTSATAYTVRKPDGTVVGSGSTGVAFNNGGLSFTITAGGTPAVAGDKFNITVTASGSDTDLVLGTDFELNRPMGLVRILSGSAVPEGAPLKISGAYAGSTGTRIRGATKNEIRCRILFDGINLADQSEVTAQVYEAVLSADSEFDFLPDDFGNVSLTGTAKTPTGKTEPFIVDLKTPV